MTTAKGQTGQGRLAGAVLLAGLLHLPTAGAVGFVETFDGTTLDPVRWATLASGGSTLQLVGGQVLLTQGSSGEAVLGLRLPVTGDFRVTVDYTLLNWPTDSKARLLLNAYASEDDQIGVLRLSDTQYDTPYPGLWPPGHVHGEAYLFSRSVLGPSTNDVTGTLRLQRLGDVVTGSFRSGSGSGWADAGSLHLAGEGGVARLLGVGLFGLPQTTTAGVQVALDNFTLAAPVPEPQAWALWLAGLALLGACARPRARPGP